MASLGNANSNKAAHAEITIASGGTISDSIDCRGRQALAFIVPAMTGTSLVVQASIDDTNFYAVSYNGVAVTIPASATATYQAIPSNVLAGAEFVRLVSSGAEAAKRSITVVGLQLVN